MSTAFFVGVLLGLVIGIGATLAWAAYDITQSDHRQLDEEIRNEAEAVVKRLTESAEQVRTLMRDIAGRR